MSGGFPSVSDRVEQEQIDLYAELSGDFNPLHVDPEAAAASEFGGIVAHGPIALQPFLRALTEWLGVEALPPGAEVQARYRAPTRPGDTITCVLRDQRALPGGRIELEADCANQKGVVVISVSAVVPGPADAAAGESAS
jgi:3-hydroxybutyryl-CoA dehydratase